MPSPFPGMDPFIEGQKWHSFHGKFIHTLGDVLVSRLAPRYAVDVEEYVFLTREDGDAAESGTRAGPDVSVAVKELDDDEPADRRSGAAPATATVASPAIRPYVLTIPMPQRRVQRYLVIRTADDERVVTAIELLSPKNKQTGTGRREYLLKRRNILNADANLVELDLLRGGRRLPTRERLPAGDFY